MCKSRAKATSVQVLAGAHRLPAPCSCARGAIGALAGCRRESWHAQMPEPASKKCAAADRVAHSLREGSRSGPATNTHLLANARTFPAADRQNAQLERSPQEGGVQEGGILGRGCAEGGHPAGTPCAECAAHRHPVCKGGAWDRQNEQLGCRGGAAYRQKGADGVHVMCKMSNSCARGAQYGGSL